MVYCLLKLLHLVLVIPEKGQCQMMTLAGEQAFPEWEVHVGL